MPRYSILVAALVALALVLSSCTTTSYRFREYPVYEMRKVQVGSHEVPRRKQIQVGERPVTTTVREPVERDANTPPDAPAFVERTITTMEPVFEERTIRVATPIYEWQRATVRVRKRKYEVVEISWVGVAGGVLSAAVLGVLATVFVLVPLGAGL